MCLREPSGSRSRWRFVARAAIPYTFRDASGSWRVRGCVSPPPRGGQSRRFCAGSNFFEYTKVSERPFAIVPFVRVTILHVLREFPARHVLLNPSSKLSMPHVGSRVVAIVVGIARVDDRVSF